MTNRYGYFYLLFLFNDMCIVINSTWYYVYVHPSVLCYSLPLLLLLLRALRPPTPPLQ